MFIVTVATLAYPRRRAWGMELVGIFRSVERAKDGWEAERSRRIKGDGTAATIVWRGLDMQGTLSVERHVWCADGGWSEGALPGWRNL